MADKKRVKELMSGVTHPTRMKGKAPSPMPDYIRKLKESKNTEERQAEPAPPQQDQIPQSTGFTEEEAEKFRKATKIPKELEEGLKMFLLKLERIKADPEKRSEFQRLMVEEFTGDE